MERELLTVLCKFSQRFAKDIIPQYIQNARDGLISMSEDIIDTFSIHNYGTYVEIGAVFSMNQVLYVIDCIDEESNNAVCLRDDRTSSSELIMDLDEVAELVREFMES